MRLCPLVGCRFRSLWRSLRLKSYFRPNPGIPCHNTPKQFQRPNTTRPQCKFTFSLRQLLGQAQHPESKAAYPRFLAELQTVGPSVAATPTAHAGNRIVNEVLLALMQHAENHYLHRNGTPTTEVKELKWSISPVCQLHVMTRPGEFGPRALAAVRQHMIGVGLCRTLWDADDLTDSPTA